MIALFEPAMPNADAILPYLRKIDESGWYSNNGPLVQSLESRIATQFHLTGQGCVVAAANGTLALAAALMAARPKGRSGHCLMPSWTFAASAQAARLAGLEPLFGDVDPQSWALTPQIAKATLTHTDQVIRAVMPVTPFGAPIDHAAWDLFEQETGVAVVIDAAGGFDALKPGRAPTVVSLSATKTLGAGEGALVLSQDATRLATIPLHINYGMAKGQRRADTSGLNGKMSEYHAAVALAALDLWPSTRLLYQAVAKDYVTALEGITGVRLQPGFGEDWVSTILTLQLGKGAATQLAQSLAEEKIPSRQWWGLGCHHSPQFQDCPRGDLRVTQTLAEKTLGLPYHSHLDQAQVERIASVVRTFMEANGA